MKCIVMNRTKALREENSRKWRMKERRTKHMTNEGNSVDERETMKY